ncbi:tetratricopeptide repeat protein [Deferrisoma camini]|uniref:tetratricopeptide repeat protein n=1 Tax=Deferrisoma camini TaxID=1035120 RepID=UPI00146F4963|nr:tetratricopeptide repeat protein [Deferrisoma camini]
MLGNRRFVCVVLLFAFVGCALLLFGRVAGFAFLGMDDSHYLSDNPRVLSGLSWASVCWALTNTEVMYWHPVTWLSFMAEVDLFGLNPASAHLINAVLHGLNTFLVYRIWRSLGVGGTGAVAGAVLFLVHPLQVESVAWVAERKTLLCAFFAFLAVSAHVDLRASRSPVARFGMVAVLFVLAMGAKPAAGPLPLVLLALDLWVIGWGRPKTRVKWRAAETALMLGIGAALSAVTLAGMEATGMRLGADFVPWGQRLLESFAAWGAWLGRVLVPAALNYWYPPPRHLWGAAVAGAGVLACLVLTAWGLRRRFPHAAAGIAWYVLMLVPGLGLERGGTWPFAADRFQYLALAGLFPAIVVGGGRFLSDRRLKGVAWGGAVALLMAMTWAQTWYWGRPGRFFERAARLYPEDALALNAAGLAAAREGLLKTAVLYFGRALEIDPCLTAPRRNLAVAWSAVGRFDAALAHAQALEACGRDPAGALLTKARVLAKQGRYTEAREACARVLQDDPRHGEGNFLMGHILLAERAPAEAEAFLRKALRGDDVPVAAVLRDLGAALLLQNRNEEALEVLQQTGGHPSSDPETEANLGLALLRLGRCEEAREALLRALAMDPELSAARANLRLLDDPAGCGRESPAR